MFFKRHYLTELKSTCLFITLVNNSDITGQYTNCDCISIISTYGIKQPLGQFVDTYISSYVHRNIPLTDLYSRITVHQVSIVWPR